MPDQGRLMPDFDLTNKSYDEIIYEEEPEYELGDHAMLKRYGDSQHQGSKSLVCIVWIGQSQHLNLSFNSRTRIVFGRFKHYKRIISNPGQRFRSAFDWIVKYTLWM